MLKHWPAPWVLVMIGIAMNIFAAIISNYYISLNNDNLHQVENEISRIDVRINSFWQESQTIERKKEFVLLLTQLGKLTDDPLVRQYTEQFMDQLAADYQLQQSVSINADVDSRRIIDMIDKARNKIINDIDDIYLDRIMLEKQKQPIVNDNSRLMSIALFLQMLGLILVLAKDLQKT